MNTVQFFEYGKSRGFNLAPNTIIINGATAFGTKEIVASKFGIPVSTIQGFEIKNGSVFYNVTQDYVINTAINVDQGVTAFRDLEGRCKGIGNDLFFRSGGQIYKESYFPGVTSVGQATGSNIFWNETGLIDFYFPNCLTWGNTTAADIEEGFLAGTNVFRSGAMTSKTKVYVHPSVMTSNSGALEGDLAFVQAAGAQIIPVTNFNKPVKINDLGVEQSYSTAVKLSFTLPVFSNPFYKYKVYVDGVLNSEWESEDVFVTNLNVGSITNNITIVAVDNLFNHSLHSNSISVTTSNQAVFPLAGLTGSFTLNETSGNPVNSVSGGIQPVNNDMIQALPGKLGTAYAFNSAASYIDFQTNSYVTNRAKFSIALWFNPGGNNSGAMFGSWGAPRSWGLRFAGSRFYLGMYVNNVFKQADFQAPLGLSLTQNKWYLLIVTYDGTTARMFMDNQESINSLTVSGVAQSGSQNERLGSAWVANHLSHKYQQIHFYNRNLRFPERSELWNNGNGIVKP